MNSLQIDITIAHWMDFEVTTTGRIVACHRPDTSWLLGVELLPRFTSDPRAIVQLEQELGKRGLGERYAVALARRVG